MSNKLKAIDIKIHTYYFFDDIINIKSFDPNNIKIDENSYKNLLHWVIVYLIVYYVTMKDLKCVNINIVNPSYLIFSKFNGYFEEINKNKYLTIVPTNESKKENNNKKI